MTKEIVVIDAFVRNLRTIASQAQFDTYFFRNNDSFEAKIFRTLAEELCELYEKFFQYASEETQDEIISLNETYIKYGVKGIIPVKKKG